MNLSRVFHCYEFAFDLEEELTVQRNERNNKESNLT
jgi:hypothetical protein